MAEIPKIDSGRVGIANAPSAATPAVVYPQITPEIALLQQAKYQGTVADKLDRMSSILFTEASDQSQRAGLQWAAENPLTKQQLQAMVKGDMSQVNLGSPMNVFNNAVRKVRAFELSAHAEADATTKLLEVYQKAERGEIDFEMVQSQVKAITDGYGQSLATVDPESSFKYRASLATMGNKVIDETAKLETKKRMIANGIKVQRLYENFLWMAEKAYIGDNPIDPISQEPISKNDYVDALAQNFINNTIALVGVNGAAAYQTQLMKDLTDTKVNAISKYIAEEFGNDPEAFNKLKVGDAGKLTELYQSLSEDVKAKVFQSLFTKISTDNNIRDQQDKAMRVDREMKAVELFKIYQTTTDPIAKKNLLRQMSELKVFSFDDINKMARGETDSNPMALFNAYDGIYSGKITTSDQIRNLPIATKDKITLLGKLHSADRQDDRDLDAGIRRLAGVPIGMQFIDPKGAEFERKAKLDRDAERIRQDLIAQGKPSNAQAVLSVLGKEVEQRRNSESAKNAKTALKAYEDKAGGPITSATLPAFEEKVKRGKVSGVKENQLPRIRALVKQAEGDE